MEKLGHLHQVDVVLLTARGSDGDAANSRVNLVVVDDDTGYFRTSSAARAVELIQNVPDVRIAPCSWRGRPGGSDQPARAVLVGAAEAVVAKRAIARRFPMLQGLVVPLAFRLLRYRTVYFKVAPTEEPTPWMASAG
jgi:PPOX class probable F420-dependent enzyme